MSICSTLRVSAAGALMIALAATAVPAVGPDLIVGDLPNMDDFGNDATIAGLGIATTSCNKGTVPIGWHYLPQNTHPVIAQNFYRLQNGRMTQIGMSWLKHGFFAEQDLLCYNDCQGDATGATLGVHCSDPYSASFNAGGSNWGLGKRSEVNPVNGYYDGATANNHTGHVHTAISHRCQVRHVDLANAGARYFAEGMYIAPDDCTAGNGLNNSSYREVTVSGTPSNWFFTMLGSTTREQPAINAWPGASRVNVDPPVDGRLIVAYIVTGLGGGQYHYEYAVMNYSSDRGVQAFSAPVGAAAITNIGFAAPFSHDEGFSNAAWTATVSGGRVTWACDPYATDPNANAIRWGTMYNFWFDANAVPVSSAARMDRFKPGYGPANLWATVQAPNFNDCNNNGIADSIDISNGAPDCNGNGVPDACELTGGDCNNNGIPDQCEMAGHDCNANGIFDSCELAGVDCDGDGIPDSCEVAAHDCNGNGIYDRCELAGNDCDGNGVPDICQSDCDADGIIDACEGQADCNGNGIPDVCDIAGISGGPRTYPSGAINLAIPEFVIIGTPIQCLATGPVQDVNILVNIVHTYDNDLKLHVIHNGIDVFLLDGRGGDGHNFTNTIFDDEAPVGIETGSAPFTGSYRPEESLTLFDGTEASGPWTLTLDDHFSDNTGTLLNWSIIVTTPHLAPTSVDANNNGIPDECENCPCKGDMNGDHVLNGKDIPAFVRSFTNGYVACADMNSSGTMTTADINAFVTKLLLPNPPCP